MPDDQVQPRAGRTVVWLLAALLLWSALPRFWLITVEPDAGRLWDERFTVANVAVILLRGAWEPQNYWYGSLSYLPQLAAVAAVEGARDLGAPLPAPRTEEGRHFTPAGYVLARAFQALYGLLSIGLAYLLGRRLFSPWVGLGGAFFLAASPRHVHASSVLKPDILLALLTLAAFLAFVEALRHLRLRPYLLSGLAVGLATATKLNGGALGLPLALGTALRAGSWRRWAHLAAAGVASVAAYAVLNPQLGRIWDAFEKNRTWYDRHSPEGRGETLREMAGYLFDPDFHGPVVAALALVGAGVLARRAWAAGLRSAEGASWAAFLSFPVLYVAAYLLVTTRAKENHFLQVLPFSALLAALALEAAWRLAARRRPGAALRRAALAAAVAGVVLVAWPAMSFAYTTAVPTTEARALSRVRQALPDPVAARLVLYDPGLRRVPELGRLWAAVRVPPDPAALTAEELALADALVVRRAVVEEGGAEGVLRHLARLPPEGIHRVAGGGLEARGPEIVVAVRPLPVVGEPAEVELAARRSRPGVFRGRLPAPPAGAAWVSYSVTVPLGVQEMGRATLRVRGKALPLVFARPRGRSSMAVTPRVPAGPFEPARIEVEIEGPIRSTRWGDVTATLFAWGPAEGGGGPG
ncbi:MAG TPA: glycosyltransferase family 39 protein [Thermoanaerobaculia bacterium]